MSKDDAAIEAAPAPRPARKRSTAKPTAASAVEVSPERAQLARKIGSGCEIALATLEDAVLRLEPADEKSTRFSDPVVLCAEAGDIQFSDGTRLLRALTGIDLGIEADDGDTQWEWLQAALIGRLGGTPFRASQRVSRSGGPAAGTSVTMRVTIRSRLHAFSVLARAAATTWLDLLATGDWTVDPRPASYYSSIPFHSTVRIARHEMPAAALSDLAAGDIFLPSTARFTCDGEGTIWFGSTAVSVRHTAPGALTIIKMEGSVDLDNTGNTGAGRDDDPFAPITTNVRAAAAEPAVVESGSITVDFELGRIAMSLGALRALQAGSIIEVSGGSTASIAIVSSGQVLGRGEAVDVNGQLGIRVTQWDCAS